MNAEMLFPGDWQTFFSKPADTVSNTIYTVPSGVKVARIVSMNIATTGASNVTVWINDGTADRLQLDANVMAANTKLTETLGHAALKTGWIVKVMTHNADDATFTLTVAEQYRQ